MFDRKLVYSKLPWNRRKQKSCAHLWVYAVRGFSPIEFARCPKCGLRVVLH